MKIPLEFRHTFGIRETSSTREPSHGGSRKRILPDVSPLRIWQILSVELAITLLVLVFFVPMVRATADPLPFDEEGNVAMPCEPSGQWDCFGNDALINSITFQARDYLNLSDAGVQVRANLTGVGSEVLAIRIDSIFNPSGPMIRDELRLSGASYSDTVFLVQFRDPLDGQGEMDCGDQSVIQDIPYGVWSITLFQFAGGMRCVGYGPSSLYFFDLQSTNCGGCAISDISTAWITNQGGSNAYWVNYLRIQNGGTIPPCCPPHGPELNLETQPATNIAVVFAKLNGHLLDLDETGVAYVWFQYATCFDLASDGCGLQTFETNRQLRFTPGSFFANIQGLTPNTTYYFRAVASNQSTGLPSAAGATLAFTTRNPSTVSGASLADVVNVLILFVFLALLVLAVLGALWISRRRSTG